MTNPECHTEALALVCAYSRLCDERCIRFDPDVIACVIDLAV